MAIGTSPYNFVPLNEHIYFPEWADQISMDIPFEDGEDGIIEVEWVNDSPLFTRDMQKPDKKDAPDNQYSMHIMQPDGTRLYFLPGSSLRGMLRNVLSILSFGKMNQFTNRFYGYREFGGKDNSNHEEYQAKMKNIRYGWLKKNKETEVYSLFTRDDFYWNDVDKNTLRIHKDDLKDLYPSYAFNKETSSWEQNKLLKDAAGERFPLDASGEYRIFATGKMNKKEHEVLIPIRQDDEDIEIKLNDDTVKKFFDVYEPSPGFENFRHLLDDGEEIPVSYIKGKHNTDGIIAIGMGKMIRYPYQFDVEQLIQNQQLEYKDKRKDLSETIFGWADKSDSMKGRVQIGNAFTNNSLADDPQWRPIEGVLGTPRGSFYPFYIKQDGFKYKTYKDANCISGRKLYRIHSGGSTMDLPQGNGNENIGVKFYPIPKGQKFKMRINVHNLKKVEVGALLSAITLHKQSKVWHNIGLAKSFGFGKLHCESLELHGFTCNEHEYIVAFEQMMNNFTKKEYNKKWLNTKQSDFLFSIMSEHKNEDLKMMELEDYTAARKNSNRKDLTEDGFNAITVLTLQEQIEEKERQFRGEHQKDYEEIKKLENSEEKSDLNKAIRSINHLIELRVQEELKLDTQEDEAWKKRINERLNKIIIDEENEKANQTLDKVLEEKYPNKDEYKVKDWKACLGKIKTWMRNTGKSALDNEDKAVLFRTIKRLKDNCKRAEQKDWENKNSKIWKGFHIYFTPEDIDCI